MDVPRAGGYARKPGRPARIREQRPLTIAPPGVPAALRCRESTCGTRGSGRAKRQEDPGHRARYERITKSMTMPWYFLAIIHGRSRLQVRLPSAQRDPLTGRTVHVPAGRPTRGKPPFSWEESATDAIAVNRYDKWNDWSIAGMLVAWERYNGLGYRPHGIHSPYVWACTDLYAKGRYVAKGRLMQRRIGAMRRSGNAQGTDRDRLGVAAGGSEIGYCSRAGSRHRLAKAAARPAPRLIAARPIGKMSRSSRQVPCGGRDRREGCRASSLSAIAPTLSMQARRRRSADATTTQTGPRLVNAAPSGWRDGRMTFVERSSD